VSCPARVETVHDEIVTVLDDHLSRLTQLREILVAARPVHPGERLAAVEQAIAAAEDFAAHAGRAIGLTEVV
jgi:hypothetical protein